MLRCTGCAHVDWSVRLRQEELQNLKAKISLLENEKSELEHRLPRPDSNLIETKKDGKTYSDDLRMAIYKCIDNNVAVDKVENVVRSVVKHITNKELSAFPDTHTCRNMVREMNMLSKIQVAVALQNAENTTLKYDGTTKAKQHWVEAQIATDQATLTIGVGKTAGGSAQVYRDYITKSISTVGKDFNLLCTIVLCPIAKLYDISFNLEMNLFSFLFPTGSCTSQLIEKDHQHVL